MSEKDWELRRRKLRVSLHASRGGQGIKGWDIVWEKMGQNRSY